MEESDLQNPEKPREDLDSSVTYNAEIDKIVRSTIPLDEKLNLIDLLIKDYLRKKFHIKKIDEYSDIIDFFLEKNKPHIATLCHEMVEALYSGDAIDVNKLNVLVDDFKAVLISEQSPSEKSRDEASFKSLISPITNAFSKMKKKVPSNFNTSYVSKQIKRTVEGSLAPNDVSSDAAKQSNGKNLTLNRDILDTLSPVNSINRNLLGPDEYYMIESIDDLGRIKKKIKLRRMVNIQDNQTQVSQQA